MLDRAPDEPRWLSWLYVLLWSGTILATVPLARTIADYVSATVGTQAFLWGTAVVVIAGLAAGVRLLLTRTLPANAYVWLLVFGGALLWLIWQLRGVPVEAFHVVQYGILSLLCYRALVHRVADQSVYVMSALLAGIMGIADEWLQWLVPDRFWGIQDIGINFSAAVLTQGALALGLRPRIVAGQPSGSAIRRIAYLLALGLAMLGISYANTPDRIAEYATRLPILGYLLDNQGVMIEYGYLYHDPEIGKFRSRFDREMLRELDRTRGHEVAMTIARFPPENDWHRFTQLRTKFQRQYTILRDSYVHEFGIHLFRRNSYLVTARDLSRPKTVRNNAYFIAHKENMILEKYFPSAIGHSIHRWSAATRAAVEAGAGERDDYISPVSQDLVTRFSRRQVTTGFTVAVVVVLLLGIFAGRSVAR